MFHRLAVADLADQDHVGRLAQRVLQRHLPAQRVHADFAVRDDAAAVRMHELDRVLDRHDVTLAVLVAMADHRRQRVRLARAGRAHHDDQPALGHHHVLQHRRQLQFADRRDLGLDRAQHHPAAAHLHERVDAEAPDAGGADREVHLLAFLELGGLTVVHQGARQFGGVAGRQRHAGHRYHLAVDLERRRKLGRQEQIGAIAAEHQPQQVLQEFRRLFAFHRVSDRLAVRERPECGTFSRGSFP